MSNPTDEAFSPWERWQAVPANAHKGLDYNKKHTFTVGGAKHILRFERRRATGCRACEFRLTERVGPSSVLKVRSRKS